MPITKTARENAPELKIFPDRLELLDKKLRQFLNEGYMQCLAAKVLRRGQTIFEGTYGTSAPDEGAQSLKIDAIFPVASITKPIIAALIMRLHQDGEIDITHQVRAYLPEFQSFDKREPEEREPVAIWHLLTHTGGLADEEFYERIVEYLKNELGIEVPEKDDDAFFGALLQAREKLGLPEISNKEQAAHETREYIAMRLPSIRHVREVMTYCSFGYGVLKDLLVRVCGKPIDKIAQELLFEPLGMNDSHFILPKEKWDRVVVRGENCLGYPWQNSLECFVSESGGGGLKSTVNDMIRFCEMIRCGGELDGVRVLSPFTVQTMGRNFNFDMSEAWNAWGLGFNYRSKKIDDLSVLRPETTLDHSGYGGSKIFIDIENGLSFAYFSAQAKGLPVDIFSNIVYSALDI